VVSTSVWFVLVFLSACSPDQTVGRLCRCFGAGVDQLLAALALRMSEMFMVAHPVAVRDDSTF
jgi:hypothetical protein